MLDYTKVESRLKSFLKNNKRLGYSVALLVSFLINGGFSYAVETRAELRNRIVQEQESISQMLKDSDKSISDIELKIKKLTQRGEFWVKPLERSYQVAFITSFGNYTKNRNRTEQNFTEPEYGTPGGRRGSSGNIYMVDINGITELANNKAETGNKSNYKGSYIYKGKNYGEYGIIKNPLEFVDKIDFGANITPKAVAEKTVAVKTVSETRVTEPRVSVSKIDVSRVTVTPPSAPIISAPANPGNPSVNVTAPGAITPLGTITVAAIPAINVSVAAPVVGAAPTVNAPTVATPPTPAGFNPKIITPPVAPAEPVAPVITAPTFNLISNSSGNGAATEADMSSTSNGAIQSVVLTKGNFKVIRDTSSRMNYSYNNYAGKSPWGTPTTDSGNTFSGNSWSNWSRTGATTSSYLGFQKVVVGAMLSNSNNLFTNVSTSTLREFVHMDHHNNITPTSVESGFNAGLAESTWDSTVSSGSNTAAVKGAFEDLRDNINSTAAHGNSATPASHMFIWMQSGRIVMEGSYNVVTNNYDHNGFIDKKSIAANVGDIVIQPHKDTGGNVKGTKSAVFSLSPGGNNPGHLSIMYNGSTGNMDLWTTESAVFLNSETAGKPIAIVNRGTINMYGQKSAGIYNSQTSKMDVQFVDKGFTFNAATNTATGNYRPINIYGDGSVGIYWDRGNTGSIEGNFAVNIGASGVGNKNFTTKATSAVTGGAETNGVALSNYDVNSSDTATTNKDYIRGSFGILSDGSTNLTSHQIKIFDKTQGNVGVMPSGNALLNIGGGNIAIEGGTTAKDNIGIYIDGKGAVKSTGDIKVSGGVGNLAIFAKGYTGTIPGSAPAHVSVRKIEGTNTKNSILVFGTTGAKITASEGLTMTGATVEADATVANKKDSGAVFSSGSGTVITINRAALLGSENISITGTEQVDAKNAGTGKYVGFGLMAKDGGKINAQYNNISVTNGSTGIASIGKDGANVASEIDLSHSKLSYNGKGYAVYTDGTGKVNLDDTELNLRGSSTAFDVDLSASVLPIHINSGTKIKIHSDDVTVFNVKNASGLTTVGGIETSIKSKIETKLGLSPGALAGLFTGSTSIKYKTAAADGGSLAVGNLDKSGVETDTVADKKDGYEFFNRFLAQRLVATTNK
ncbi:hypothetical protein RN96_14355, partial [Fusobacterium polymorphum]